MNKIKIIIGIFIMIALSSNITAQEVGEYVTLSRCIDGDTAAFIVNGKEEKVRFLAINAPEYTKEKEAYGKEASAYVCDRLRQANTIALTYEESNLRDKYDRLLAWVFVDDMLLQKELVQQGLAEVKYIYGDYEYTDELYKEEDQAKKQHLNMWSDKVIEEKDIYYYASIGGIVILMIFVVLFKKTRKKSTLNKLSKELKKRLK